MKIRIALALAVVAGSLALASNALAHTVAVQPRSGNFNTFFKFKGRAWQPLQRVRVEYFVQESLAPSSRGAQGRSSGTLEGPSRTFNVTPRRNGTFTFSFTRPVAPIDEGITARLCFQQFDSRPRFRRSFRSCASFYVAPPSAQFLPAVGQSGEQFVLVAEGFIPGRALSVTLVRPDGVVETYSMTTRARGAFLPAGTLGRIFVPRGGAMRLFPGGAPVVTGIYTARVNEETSGQRAWTAVQVLPG